MLECHNQGEDITSQIRDNVVIQTLPIDLQSTLYEARETMLDKGLDVLLVIEKKERKKVEICNAVGVITLQSIERFLSNAQ
ncbi:hypothetical protein ACTL6P_18420 [Endozoicomonas acroporae]|uniref:hypothetical protein n=1 Tax=Endozoicomonas acroporae TaxID=1701104 RepID=UPI000C773837|nr:hypothetical protein [Endozoicomonas acroporae]